MHMSSFVKGSSLGSLVCELHLEGLGSRSQVTGMRSRRSLITCNEMGIIGNWTYPILSNGMHSLRGTFTVYR